jgi:hypothetical protein
MTDRQMLDLLEVTLAEECPNQLTLDFEETVLGCD